MLVIAKSESHRTGSRKEAPCCCCCLKDFSNTGYLQGWVLFIQYRLLKKHGEKAESGGISYPMCGHVHICTHTHLSRGRVYKTDLLSVLIFEVLYVFFFNNAQQKQTPKLCVSFCLSTNCLVHWIIHVAWLQPPLQSWSYPLKRCHISSFHLYSWPNPHLRWHRHRGNHKTGAVSVNWREIYGSQPPKLRIETGLNKDFYAQRLLWIDPKHTISYYLKIEFKNKSENSFTNEAPGMTWLHAACGCAAGCSAKFSEMTPRWPNEM